MWFEQYTYQYKKTGDHFNGTDQATSFTCIYRDSNIPSHLCLPYPNKLDWQGGWRTHNSHRKRKTSFSENTSWPSFEHSREVHIKRDVELYQMALRQFMKEINWLEGQLNCRILCDSSLDRWEEELQYHLGNEQWWKTKRRSLSKQRLRPLWMELVMHRWQTSEHQPDHTTRHHKPHKLALLIIQPDFCTHCRHSTTSPRLIKCS